MNYIIVGGYLLVGGAIVFYALKLMLRKWSNSALNDAIPIAVVALVVVLALFFPYWALNGIPGIVGVLRVDANGPLGDFVTGVASPLLQFVLLFYVVRAYYLQKTELKETKNALEEQARVSSNTQFQMFVFQVFEEHRKIKSEIVYRSHLGDVAFNKLYVQVIYDAKLSQQHWVKEDLSEQCQIAMNNGTLQFACDSLLNVEELGFSRYFRYVYSFLRIASERVGDLKASGESSSDTRYEIEIEQLYNYIRMYRSMLSNNEKKVLLLNGFSTNGKPMVRYLKEFKILKDVDLDEHSILGQQYQVEEA